MTKNTIRIRNGDAHDGGSIDLNIEEVRLADGSRLTETHARELAQEMLHASERVGRAVGAPA